MQSDTVAFGIDDHGDVTEFPNLLLLLHLFLDLVLLLYDVPEVHRVLPKYYRNKQLF